MSTSHSTLSLRRREIAQLTARLERNKNRVGELIEQLTGGALLENTSAWNNALDEYNALNLRIGQDEIRLSQLRCSSQFLDNDFREP